LRARRALRHLDVFVHRRAEPDDGDVLGRDEARTTFMQHSWERHPQAPSGACGFGCLQAAGAGAVAARDGLPSIAATLTGVPAVVVDLTRH
jgi:hypothetical protein